MNDRLEPGDLKCPVNVVGADAMHRRVHHLEVTGLVHGLVVNVRLEVVVVFVGLVLQKVNEEWRRVRRELFEVRLVKRIGAGRGDEAGENALLDFVGAIRLDLKL
jgi:hypothetical protein